MQDFEFTIEKGTLFMLQTRGGKRTAQAAVKIAVDMVKEKFFDKETAIMRITPEQIEQLLHPMFDDNEEKKSDIFSKSGLPASVRSCAIIICRRSLAAVADFLRLK